MPCKYDLYGYSGLTLYPLNIYRCASYTKRYSPVGWLPNFHNAGPKAGGDIAILSDDLHHPITGLLYEARPQATRLKVNGSLCVRSEAYEPFVASEYFRSDTSSTHASIICSDGYALTGLAVAGTTTSLSKSAPRCGEPAGFTVQTSQKFDAPAISSTTATTVATASDCSYRAMECPEGSVAVGFKFDEAYASGHTGYCGANYYSLKLICAPYTPTDSANYRRVCANAACSGALGTPQQPAGWSPRPLRRARGLRRGVRDRNRSSREGRHVAA